MGSTGNCGEFRNPAPAIAQIYREELVKRRDAFECIAFAIYYAGDGPGNFEPLSKILDGT